MDSTAYYEHNAEKYIARSLQRLDRGALDAFSNLLPAGAKVLDAGCGAGRDLVYFRSKGFFPEGFDASRALADHARELSGCPVWQADFRLLSLKNGAYDGIWANRSLAHLPAEGIQRALACFFFGLKPGGILFLSTEVLSAKALDRSEVSRKLEDRSDDPEGPPRFFFRFHRDDLASFIRQHGFQLLAQGEIPSQPERVGFLARRITVS